MTYGFFWGMQEWEAVASFCEAVMLAKEVTLREWHPTSVSQPRRRPERQALYDVFPRAAKKKRNPEREWKILAAHKNKVFVCI